MKQSDLTVWLSAFPAIATYLLAANLHAATPAPTAGTLGQTPLYFTENKGQWDERVLYKADGGAGLTWWFERDGLTIAVAMPDTSNPLPARLTQPLPARGGWQDERGVGYGEPTLDDPPPRKGHALKLRFVPSPSQTPSDLVIASAAKQSLPTQTASEVIPEGKLGWNNNYFLGNDSSKWAPDCGNFTRLTYRNVWPGVDVVYYGEGDHLKYDYVVKPGADPADVRLRWLGLDEPLVVSPSSLTASDSGAAKDGGGTELLLATSVGTLREALPLAYQRDASGNRVPVAVTMKVLTDNEFGLEVVGAWDKGKELVVDPLVWSTYLGGSYEDCAYATASSEGNTIVTGSTESDDFPVNEGAFDNSFNEGSDAFVTKFNQLGNELIYCTYVGGSTWETAFDIIADLEGGAVITGQTRSRDFPTTQGVYSRNYLGGYDIFVTSLNVEGDELIYSTLLGGRRNEVATTIAFDGSGGVYIAGTAESEEFPIVGGAFDPTGNGRDDTFVARFMDSGTNLYFSTYLGGRNDDGATAVIMDEQVGVIVTGITSSGDFPTSDGAFNQEHNGNRDGFVTKLNADGNELIYSTYLGGSINTPSALSLSGIEPGEVFVAGLIYGGRFPMTDGAFDSHADGWQDAYVARLSRDGTELLCATYLGGDESEDAKALTNDGVGGIAVTGWTDSDDFPVTRAGYDQSRNGGRDIFVARLSGDLSELEYGTYLGGDGVDCPYGLSLSAAGTVVVSGQTYSSNFPTTRGAFDERWNNINECFITYISISNMWWEDMPDVIEVAENDFIEFTIRGMSTDENARLNITYTSENLPDSVHFIDNNNQSCTFSWHTTFDDAGEYTAIFTLSDSENEISAEVRIIVNDVNSVTNPQSAIPADYFLADAFPNPFNSSTTIRYGLPVAGMVSLSVYDLSGKKVAVLMDGYGDPSSYAAGWHEIVWDAGAVPAGVYLVELNSGKARIVREAVIVK